MDKNGLLTIVVSLLVIGIILTSYSLGLVQGKLEKLEQYEKVYMPNPDNVYPTAIDGVYTNDTTGGE